MKIQFVLLVSLILSFQAYGQEGQVKVGAQSEVNEVYNYDKDLLSPSFHESRRASLRDSMPPNSVALLFASPIRVRSADINYEYHQNPDFYYLTGLREPNALLMIFKENVSINDSMTNEILFVQDRNLEKEIWNGKRLGAGRVNTELGIETGLVNTSFADLPINYSNFNSIFFLEFPEDIIDDNKDRGDLYSLIRHFKKRTDSIKESGILDYKWLRRTLDGLRERKTEEELVLLKKAIDITVEAQLELMKTTHPGMAEYEAEAVVEYVFKKNGAEKEGFPSILGGGENSCILHYTTNRKVLEGNHLLVSDIGAEYHGYTADVTRTIPIDGKFSEEEKEIYELVLAAQNAALEACKKGNKFWDPHNAATKVIQKGLLNLGITKKYYESKKYFMHGTSHYLGLDVHDAGGYGSLQPGNVITIEPGIYIPAGSDCDPKWWNIGVRIEDDILITTTAPVMLSAAAPRTIDEIEKIMTENSSCFIAK